MSTEAFDMTDTIIPRSDQINAEDILTGPVTITITGVKRGSAEQPVDMINAEFPGRAYRPSKTMRRVIVNAWGKDTSAYIGRRIRIYRDPEVTFGRDKVGGIKVSHLSHIDKRLEVALTVTRGQRKTFVVEPLPDTPPTTPAEPAPEGALSESARKKWFNSMLDIFSEANAIEPPEKLTVIKSITGDADLLEPLELADVELRKVVTTLSEWKKDGTLVDKVAEVLDMAAIQAESEGGES
jgi:hypothetical protein